MMKKIALSMVGLAMSFYVFGSCYSTWNSAFSAATTSYNSSLSRCQSALSTVRCINEANIAYDSAVNTAGEAYYNCNIE